MIPLEGYDWMRRVATEEDNDEEEKEKIGNNEIEIFYFSLTIITHHLHVDMGKVSRKHIHACILES